MECITDKHHIEAPPGIVTDKSSSIMEEIHRLSRKVKCFVCLTHFFTTLGARMWWFGVGLFIIEVAPNSLQLTAIYGFSNGGALLLLSTLVGDIIDRTARLTAARVALFLNNFGIVLCCIVVFFVFRFRSEIESKLPDEGLLKICFALIIILTIFSNLCNLGRTLVMERDWIVEICGRKQDRIATMSATFRFIDLSTKAIASLVTGQLMTYVSSIYGPVFIGCWNIFSFFVEFWLIGVVYRMNPRLHSKGLPEYGFEVQEKVVCSGEDKASGQIMSMNKKTEQNDISLSSKETMLTNEVREKDVNSSLKTDTSLCGKLFSSFISLYRGWRHYKQYQVALSGLALAFLYFTVLGFDNITIGYAFSQGMTESVLGILVFVSATFGILASILYPFIRKCTGLVNTGLIGLTCQISCLTLCVISLWLPGGTFGPPSDMTSSYLNTTAQTNSTSFHNTTEQESGNEIGFRGISGMSTSLIVLFVGIVGARFGVWTADLTISQLFMENVDESERGLVNGFQSSLNKMMDMLKFVMVMFIPDPSMFGYPALVSYCFICLAWILFTVYKKKSTGTILSKHCL